MPCVGHAVAAGWLWDVAGSPGHEGVWHKVPCFSRGQLGKEAERVQTVGKKVNVKEKRLCPCDALLCWALLCSILQCQAAQDHAALCHAVPCCAVLWHVAHAKPCQTFLCQAVLSQTGLRRARLGCPVKCHAILCSVEPGCAVLCLAALYHAMPCHAVPCRAVPYHSIPYCAIPSFMLFCGPIP